MDNNDIETIIYGIDKERERIAKDLHDSSLQNIVHLIHKIDIAQIYLDRGDNESVRIQLDEVNDGLKNIVDNIRSVIYDLKPMSFCDVGFKPALEQYINRLKFETDIEFVYSIEDIKFDDNILVCIFRVIQECLINVIKHSEADRCTINIHTQNGILNIQITDNGKGYDVDSIDSLNHFGISFAKERINSIGGKMDILSSDEGTEYNIVI